MWYVVTTFCHDFAYNAAHKVNGGYEAIHQRPPRASDQATSLQDLFAAFVTTPLLVNKNIVSTEPPI